MSQLGCPCKRKVHVAALDSALEPSVSVAVGRHGNAYFHRSCSEANRAESRPSRPLGGQGANSAGASRWWASALTVYFGG